MATYLVNGLTTTLAQALDVLQSASGGATLVINRPVRVGATRVVPEWVRLVFTRAGCIDFAGATGVVLTFDSCPEAGPWSIFPGAASGQVVFHRRPPFVLPDWWGAIPLETKDSSPAFQAAVASLRDTGGEVRFSGIYSILQTLRLGSGIDLAGISASISRLKTGVRERGDTPEPAIELQEGARGVCLRGFGVEAGTRPSRQFIRMTGGSDIRIEDVTLWGAMETGILQQPAVGGVPGAYIPTKGLRLRNLSIQGCPVAVDLQYASDVLVDQVIATYRSTDAALEYMITGVRVGDAGMPWCRDVLIQDCTIQQWGIESNRQRDRPEQVRRSHGIHVVKVDGLRIVGCYFEPNYGFYSSFHDRSPDDAWYHPVILFDTNSVGPAGAEVGFNRLRKAWRNAGRDITPLSMVSFADSVVRTYVHVWQALGRFRSSVGGGPKTALESDAESNEEREFPVTIGDMIRNGNPGQIGPWGWSCSDVEPNGMHWDWLAAGALDADQTEGWGILRFS